MAKTKAGLTDAVAERAGLPRIRAEALVNQIFQCITEALKQGDHIDLRGFGTFKIKRYDGYDGRNPRTGEHVHVKPKRQVLFKAGKDLREKVDASRSPQSTAASARATSVR